MKIFFLISLLLSLPAFAVPYTPQMGDEIIARWAIIPKATPLRIINSNTNNLSAQDIATVVALANRYLAQASQPGHSRFYGAAQTALKPLIEKINNEKNSTNKNLWLAWAQVQQHQHNFDIAQQALEKVLQQDPTNENANLLIARINVIQAKPLAARNACLKLLGNADLLTVTACSLEANSYLHPDQLTDSYQQLVDIVNSQGLPNDERGIWLIQMLADFSMRNNDAATAAHWLDTHLNNASVNYLAQWSDVQLALNHAQTVKNYLEPIVSAAAEIDDALLLRLALAEKNSSAEHRWQNQLAERIDLREQRQDSLHSSELALYYLDINRNPQKALYWAKINFSNNREYNDKKLLARAETANNLKGIE